MFETGIATHSKHQIDPILHLLVIYDGSYRTWCGGGPAQRENTVTQRRCPKCLALARGDIVDVELDEATDLDWYLGREVKQ